MKRTHCQEPQNGLHTLAERLRRGSRKLTGARQRILSILQRQAHPLSIKEIRDSAEKPGCDLVTIYRSIYLLEKMGMVARYDFGDGVARYELLREGDDGHHHHLVCTRCAEVMELEDCFTPELEERIARRSGFSSVTHKLEFFGVCPDCQAGPRQPD